MYIIHIHSSSSLCITQRKPFLIPSVSESLSVLNVKKISEAFTLIKKDYVLHICLANVVYMLNANIYFCCA